MARVWFKRKTYGWGWTPVTWEGWLVTILYVLGILYIFRNTNSLTTFIPIATLYTFALIIIGYMKGEEPRWQWGTAKKKKSRK